MEITEVRIFLADEDRLKAYVTVTFDKCFVVRDLKVINGNTGLFVAMPSKKGKDGTYKDIAHPINSDFRQRLEEIIISRYHEELQSGKIALTSAAADAEAHVAAGAEANATAHVSEDRPAPIQRVVPPSEPEKAPVIAAYDLYRESEAGIGPSSKK